MSGKENYVSGSEAERFFHPFHWRKKYHSWYISEPAQGGFSIRFPQLPSQYFNNSSANDRWEYEVVDEKSMMLCFQKEPVQF